MCAAGTATISTEGHYPGGAKMGRAMPDLYEAINDLVEQRLRDAFETGETINVPDLVSQITESLADVIEAQG
jgi:hypothetical protein